MKQVIGVLVVLTVFAACSVSKKIERNYMGQSRAMLLYDMGEPDRIVELENGGERFFYVKEEIIRETAIGTGKTTLDPRVSPGFTKIETYRFDINEDGFIVNTGYTKEIEK
ncbi:MAG: hypothetical protein PF436_11520 [Prolixibacteraceae bacterium]|jgi:outer membrane protein assembly factor BamE (lipoprotein component of BamABCDE complex)|nr:hypothetical protein [Prolixibacteraceae bacterium]